jgi:hypothetical protein
LSAIQSPANGSHRNGESSSGSGNGATTGYFTSVYVGNISFSATKHDVMDRFLEFGNVDSVKMLKDEVRVATVLVRRFVLTHSFQVWRTQRKGVCELYRADGCAKRPGNGSDEVSGERRWCAMRCVFLILCLLGSNVVRKAGPAPQDLNCSTRMRMQ